MGFYGIIANDRDNLQRSDKSGWIQIWKCTHFRMQSCQDIFYLLSSENKNPRKLFILRRKKVNSKGDIRDVYLLERCQ